MLFLLLPLVGANVEPKLVGSSVISIRVYWDIDLNSQQPQSAAFSSFSFLNTSKQRVSFQSSLPFTSASDEYENHLLQFELDPRQSVQRVALSSTVVVNPEEEFEQVTGNLNEFTQATELVKITPQISAKARELVEGESNPLKKIAILTSWVHNNVEYDLSYKDVIADSQTVFEIRKGVCNEFSHLLLAMLRSLDIPARFSAGYVYSGEVWAPHAWVEVAINGRWYPFDATYNEGIILDGTHLKFANGIDQSSVTEQFSARGNVNLSQVSITRSEEVDLVSYTDFSKGPKIEFFVTNQTVDANSIQNITISIQSTHSEVMAFPVALDVPEEVEIISEKTQLLMLFPSEKKFFSWTVLIPATLQPGFLYTFPLVVRSLGVKAQSVLQAQKNNDGDASVQAQLQVEEVRLNGNSLVFSIKNTGNSQFESVTAQVELQGHNLQREFSLAAGKETELRFNVDLNLTSTTQGNLTLTTSNYSLSQAFLLRPPRGLDSTVPALNIQTRSIVEEGDPFKTIQDNIIYAGAILLIIFIAIIIKLRFKTL